MPAVNPKYYGTSAAVGENIFTKVPWRRQGSFPAPVFDAAADGMAYQTCPKHLYKEIIILYDQGYSDQWRNADSKCKVADME